jgi:anti-sigma factor RsiW
MQLELEDRLAHIDHAYFEAAQTAALYVAYALDQRETESFELHMMTCLACVEAVEMWRAMKENMPKAMGSSSRTTFQSKAATRRR